MEVENSGIQGGRELPVEGSLNPSPATDISFVEDNTNSESVEKNVNSEALYLRNRWLENYYRRDCKPPFIVHFEKIDESTEQQKRIGNTSILHFSNSLRRIAPRHVD